MPARLRNKLLEARITAKLQSDDATSAMTLVQQLLSERALPFECAAFTEIKKRTESMTTDQAHTAAISEQPLCEAYGVSTWSSQDKGRPVLFLLRQARLLETRSFRPVKFTTPKYPVEQIGKNTRGYVVLEFETSDKGRVFADQITVVESSPEGVFDQAAIEAAKHFEYPVLKVNGKKRGVTRLRNRFSFEEK